MMGSQNLPDSCSSHWPFARSSFTMNQELLGQGCSAYCLCSRSGIPNSVFPSPLQIKSWWWPLKEVWRKPKPFISHLRTRRVSCGVAWGLVPVFLQLLGSCFCWERVVRGSHRLGRSW